MPNTTKVLKEKKTTLPKNLLNPKSELFEFVVSNKLILLEFKIFIRTIEIINAITIPTISDVLNLEFVFNKLVFIGVKFFNSFGLHNT